MSFDLQAEQRELENLRRQEADHDAVIKGNAGIHDDKDIKESKRLATLIAKQEAKLDAYNAQAVAGKSKQDEELDKTYFEFVKDKGFNELQAKQFMRDISEQSKGIIHSPTSLQQLMEKRHGEMKADIEKEAKAVQTADNDDGDGMAARDKKVEREQEAAKKNPKGAFSETVAAMASGDENYVASMQPKDIEEFYTELGEVNREFRISQNLPPVAPPEESMAENA